jgi:hypothetical protein
MGAPAPQTSTKPRRRWLGAVIAIVVLTLLVIAVLSVVPMTHGYGFSLAPCPPGGGEVKQFPNGASVVVHWYEPDGSDVMFVISQNTTILYDQTTSSGSYSFSSNGQPVNFVTESTEEFICSAADVQVYGHWTSPILVL